MNAREPVIIEAVRTAIGAFGGSLKDVEAVQLGGTVIKEVMKRAGVRPEVPAGIKGCRPGFACELVRSDIEAKYMDWDQALKPIAIDEVVMGNVILAGQGMNPARQAAIRGGMPQETNAFTVNKVCASGMKAIALACQAILAGDAEAVVAGGMENMSLAPYALPKARWGYQMDVSGKGEILDLMVYDALFEIFYGYHMGVTAENIARQYGISRREQDEVGAESHHRALKAVKEGVFKTEIVPVEIRTREGIKKFDTDERPMETSVEKMGKLAPAFLKDGTVTAGNSSGINDAAAALLITSREFAEKNGLRIRAAIRGYSWGGVDPKFMGLGPIPASRRLLQRLQYSIKDFDLIELNEAFASQAVACMKELGIPRYGESPEFSDPGSEKVNPNGSGISLGHPVGSTGARLIVSLVHEMEWRNARRGLATLCIGGGQGMAMIVERDESALPPPC